MKKLLSLSLFAILTILAAVSCSKSAAPAPVGPLPTAQQTALQDMEMYAFIHYSLNTYTDQEWGFGNEDPSLFNPSSLDTRQWVRTCKAAGMKGIIFTAKHHCGFCMWPSAYTDYSVKSSPWKDGKGDVVGELAQACREEGLRFAVYLSPWDRNHPDYGKPEYVEYFRNQLRELLTNYGEVFEAWFDGANGGSGWYGGANEMRRIDRTTYYGWPETFRMIRELQPNCVIWNDGGDRGDLRWVGTEAGFIGETNWSLLNHDGDVPYEMLHYGLEDGDSFVPGETNTSIRPGWFYHDSENGHVKSLSRLMETYYKSVGRNSTLLLNFPINREGLISQEDSLRGVAFYRMIQEVFDEDLAAGAKASATNVRGGKRRFDASRVLDGRSDTYWATDDGVTGASLTLDLGKPVTFNRLMLKEQLSLGQRVRKFSVEALVDGVWQPLSDCISEEPQRSMTTIGRKRILCFENTTATGIRINILDAKASPAINGVSLYLAPEIDKSNRENGEKISAQYNIFFNSAGGPIDAMTIDLGEPRVVTGLRYLPSQISRDGTPLDYTLLGANPDRTWTILAKGEFSNIVNNPIWQTIQCEPATYRRLRLECSRITSGTRIFYDDVEVLTE